MVRSYINFFKAEWTVLIFGIACAFLSSPGQTFLISIFVRPLTESLGFTSGQLGSLYLMATLVSAGLLPFTGLWLDRLDLRFYTATVLVALAAACGIMSIASGAISLFIGLLLLRLTGQGLMTHIAVVSTARYYDKGRGRALSFVALGMPLAEAAMPQVALVLVASVGWRMSYAMIGVALVSVAAPVLLGLIWRSRTFTQPALMVRNSRPRAFDGFRIVAATRFFWLVLPALLFMPFGSTALIFHIQMIAAIKGWSGTLIGVGFVAYAIGHGIGLLASGEFIDRFGARSMLRIMNVPFVIGIAALSLLVSAWTLPLLLGLTGFSSGLVQTTVAAVWAEVYGLSRLGTVRSFTTMLTVGGTALGPAAVGILLDNGFSIGYISSLFVFFGLAAVFLVSSDAR